jgi:hypothetical protein
VPLVGAAADAVHVLDHGTVDLERSKCATVVPDGKVVARGLDEDESGDEVGDGHWLSSLIGSSLRDS